MTRDTEIAGPVQLTLYSRVHCCLCEEMLASLRALQASSPFTIDVVDVDRAPALAARFGADVPVLVHGARELCRHRIDPAQVGAYLSGLACRTP